MSPEKQVPDRNLAMELVRVTEAASLAAARWMGRGDKEGADGAAVDAMRIVLHTVPMDGIVVIGEGEKDEAPMLYNGEKIGDGTPPATDIAVDPIDGTTLCSLGRPNAIAVIAVSERGTMFDPGPCVYMEKIAVGRDAADVIDITASPTENIEAVAKAKGEAVTDVTAVILDRPRHDALIAEVSGGSQHGGHDEYELGAAYLGLHTLRCRSRLTQYRLRDGARLGPDTSIDKVLLASAEQRLYDTVRNLLPGDLELDETPWRSEYLYSRASTIYGGTAEIQRNIIARRLLDLGKE